MQQSTACLHFAWRTTSLRVGGRAARRSCLRRGGGGRQAGATVCLVWCDGVNCVGPTAVQVHSASECVRRSHRQCLRRPTHSDAERICRAVGPTQFTPPHQTRRDGPVSVVFGVWRAGMNWQLLLTCSDFKFSVGDSLESSGIPFTPPKRTHIIYRMCTMCTTYMYIVVATCV